MATLLQAPNVPDYSSRTMCQKLCDRIMEFWSREGHTVHAWPEPDSHGTYIVKSNLINGRP